MDSLGFQQESMVFIDFSMVFIDFELFMEFSMYIWFYRLFDGFLPIFFILNRFSMTEYLELPQILSNMDQRKGPQFVPNSVS